MFLFSSFFAISFLLSSIPSCFPSFIFNYLNVYDDISVIDAHNYIKENERKEASKEELKKLQDIESEMYNHND